MKDEGVLATARISVANLVLHMPWFNAIRRIGMKILIFYCQGEFVAELHRLARSQSLGACFPHTYVLLV